MKTMIILILTLIILFVSHFSFAEDIDVVYLKNGSIIRGKIIENIINQNIKLELQDGSIMVFDYDQIEKIGVIEVPKKVTGTVIKNPGAALALSLVPPIIIPVQGLGQFYNGEAVKGVVYLITGIISIGMVVYGMEEVTTYHYYNYEETEYKSEGTASLGAILYLGSWIWSSIDAYSSAKKINLSKNYQKTLDISLIYNSSYMSRNYPQISLNYKF